MLAVKAPRLEPVPRRPCVPAWAVVIGAIWLGEVGLYAWLSGRTSGLPPLCPLRGTTGVPCPLCGSTRAVMATAQGRLLDAVVLNPLFCTALVVGAAVLLLRVGFGRRVAISLAPTPRRLAWSAAALLVALNWTYVIWHEL